MEKKKLIGGIFFFWDTEIETRHKCVGFKKWAELGGSYRESEGGDIGECGDGVSGAWDGGVKEAYQRAPLVAAKRISHKHYAFSFHCL